MSASRRPGGRTLALAASAVTIGSTLVLPAGVANATGAAATPAAVTVAAAQPAGPIDPIRPRPVRPTQPLPTLRLFHRFELVNTASGLRADVMWANTAALTGAFLWPDNASSSQEFYKLNTDNGWFRLKARHSDQCLMLDWRGGSYKNGTRVVQHPYCGDRYTPAQWKLVTLTRTSKPCRQGPPHYCGFTISRSVLVNRRTGRCLDAANARLGTPPARAVLQQWDCSRFVDDPKIGNQGWNFVDLDAPRPRPPAIH